MNKKKFLAFGATLMSAMLFASCTSPSKKVKFNENWYLDTTSSIVENAEEKLTYSVVFKPSGNANTAYRALRYNDGVYTTELSSEYSNGTLIYLYKTTLTISGEHECKTSAEKKEFTDSVTTEVRFTSAVQGLKPISSTKTILSHTPTITTQPTSINDCYTRYEYEVETTYDENLNGKSVQTIYQENGEEKKTETNFRAKDENYTTLDNEQLLFALRGMNINSTQKFNVYNNAWKRSQLVALSSVTESSEEFTITINGESKKVSIPFISVSLNMEEKNTGSSQTVKIAKTTELTNNTYRNAILSFSLPVNNAFGTFEYTLVNAEFIR